MGAWRHIKGFLAFPFMGIVLVPSILLFLVSGLDIGWGLEPPWSHATTVAGILLMVVGVYMVLAPTFLFARFGGGTVAHFDPPERFVLMGLYRYMRNPLVVGVIITVIGEALVFGARSLLVMAVLLVPINHLAIVKEEEPKLVERFGGDYRTYMENVPRWLPRLSPWSGPERGGEEED